MRHAGGSLESMHNLVGLCSCTLSQCQVCGQLPALSSFCIMLEQFASMKTHMAHMLDALCQLLHMLLQDTNSHHGNCCILSQFAPCFATMQLQWRKSQRIDRPLHCISTTACALQADSTPPAIVAGGMVYSSEKCLNHTAESTTDVTNAMW